MVTVLVVLCGIPGSGKTTIAQQIHTKFDSEPRPTIHNVAFDDGIANKEVWSERTFADSRKTGLDTVKLYLENSSSLSCDTVILVDDIMYLHSMRREMYVLARDYGAHHLLIVHVTTDIDVALARNAIRDVSTKVDEESIRRMFDRFEQPNHKLVHEKHVVHIDTNNEESMTIGTSDLIAQITIFLRTPVSTILRQLMGPDTDGTTSDMMIKHMDSVRGSCSAMGPEDSTESTEIKNPLHCLDLDLRKVIGIVMQCKEIISLGSTVRIPLAKALGEAKNNTLLHARGVDAISKESGLAYFQHELSATIDKQGIVIDSVVVNEVVVQVLQRNN